jgi:predicted transcriptional regulator
MEEVRAELVQALTKLQTEIAMKSGITDKEKDINKQLLNNEKTDKDNLAQIIEGDKGRKQERFLWWHGSQFR